MSFEDAKGVLPWKEGDPLPEDLVRAARGDYEPLMRHWQKRAEALEAENAALKETLRQFRELADTLPTADGFAQTGPYIAGVRYACLRVTQILDDQYP